MRPESEVLRRRNRVSSVQGVEGLVGKEEVDDVADAGTHVDVSLPARGQYRSD